MSPSRATSTWVALAAVLAVLQAAAASGGPPPSGTSGGPPPSGTPLATLTQTLPLTYGAAYNCPDKGLWSTCSYDEFKAIRDDIIAILPNQTWDNGNTAPAFIRLAWHNCGTYNYFADGTTVPVGGCSGAHMRFRRDQFPNASHMEIEDAANKGLDLVQALLEPIKQAHPCITYADLWTLAGSTAFNVRSGGKVAAKWCPGRCDAPSPGDGPEDGRMPDAAFKSYNGSAESKHLYEIFTRMGYNEKDIVLLSGCGHRMGRAHVERSNQDGQWDHNAVNFDTAYFNNLLGNDWYLVNQTKTSLSGSPVNVAPQYQNRGGMNLMMFATDFALRQNSTFLPYVQYYAQNQDAFYADTSYIINRLFSQGVNITQAQMNNVNITACL